jgi:hypothetical protein
MDACTGLEPGLYLVGREDGTVDEFHVRIDVSPGGAFYTDVRDEIDVAMVDHALNNAGWWWRRIGIPNALPENLDDYPSLNP